MSNLVGYSSDEEEEEEEIEQKSSFPPLPTVSTKRKFKAKLPLLEEEENTQVLSSSEEEEDELVIEQIIEPVEQQQEEEYRSEVTLSVVQNKKKRLLDEDDAPSADFFLSSRSEQSSFIPNFPVMQKEASKKHKQFSEEKIKGMVSRGESLEGVIFQQVNTDEIRTEAAYRYQQGDAMFANLQKGDMITGRGNHNIRQLANVAMKQKNDKA